MTSDLFRYYGIIYNPHKHDLNSALRPLYSVTFKYSQLGRSAKVSDKYEDWYFYSIKH